MASPASQVTTDPNAPVSNTPVKGATAFQWLAAWGVMLLIFWLLARTELGYAAIYYVLVLCALFLLATNYAGVARVLRPLAGQSSLNG